ncbi:MAG: MFS transporter [Caulobacterales bacterium]
MSDAAPAVTGRQVYAAMAISLGLMISLFWLPAQLGVLAQGYNLAPAQLSPLASLELGGFVVGTIFSSSLALADFRRWLLAGCATVLAANLALVFFSPAVPFLLARPIAGLGAGIAFGYVLKICALSPKASQNFGILTGLMSGMMIVGFQSVAYLMAQHASDDAAANSAGARDVATIVFAIYAALAIVSAIIFLTNLPPKAIRTETVAAAKPHGLPEPLAMLGLIAIVIMFIGQGAIWAFLQTLGVSHGFAVGEVANAMSAFALMGIVGSFSVTALPKNVRAWTAIGLTLPILWAGFYALYAPQSIAWYVFGCAVGGFFWNFALPQILGLLARIDPTGRASILGGSMSSIGGALGPLIAGFLIQGTNYQPVGWMAGIACFIGVVCVWFVETRGKAPSLQPS